MPDQSTSPPDRKLILELIDKLQTDLDRLKSMVEPPPTVAFDPADPRNKTPEGKLTPDGVECCYRMFDAGETRYSVARAMKISFAAATHRLAAWRKAGAEKRQSRALMG